MGGELLPSSDEALLQPLCGAGEGEDVIVVVEEWAAGVACLAQDGVGDHCKGVRQQPRGGDGVNESKDVVWELAVIFNRQFH